MLKNRPAPIFFALLAISILCSGMAASQPPSPSPIEPSQPQQAETAPTQGQTSSAPATGDPVAPITKATPAQNPTPEATKQPSEHDRKAATEWWLMAWTAVLAGVTGLLVIIAGIQAYFFWYQLGLMRIGVNDAAIAANAAKDSAEVAKSQSEVARGTLRTMQDTAERQLRAYVFLESGSIIVGSNNASLHAHMEFRNSGHTPGKRLTSWAKIDVPAEPFAFPLPDRDPNQSTSIIAPGAQITVGRQCAIGPNDLQAIMDQKKTIYLWGRVDYLDAFEMERHFIFRCAMNGELMKTVINGKPCEGWALKPHPSGYEAN